MLKTIQEKFGPGLLFAASAVGVSHLIQSTRGGGVYGLTMLAIIIFICLLKYPIFLFSVRYTASTGKTLLDGYGHLGKWILSLVFVIHLLELPFAIAGVSVVTTGIMKSVTGIALNDITASVSLVVISIVILVFGRYPLLENISKLFVVIFMVCIIAAAIMTVGSIEVNTSDLLNTLDYNKETFLFLIAIAGWMPTGVAGALGISLWIHAKGQKRGKNLSLKEAVFDFNLGYGIVILTACCFAVLGSYVFYSNNIPLQEGSAAFSTQLIGMFTSALGQWAYYVIALGSISVMFSSLLILVDLLPRISSETLIRLVPEKLKESDQRRLYTYFIVYEMLAILIVFLLLFDSFTTFINLVTTIGFLAAPIVAYLNYKVIFSTQVPKASQPSTPFRVWGLITITGLSLTTVFYLYLQATA